MYASVSLSESQVSLATEKFSWYVFWYSRPHINKIFSNFKFSEISLSFLSEEKSAPLWGYYLPNTLKDVFFSPSATWTAGHNGCKACLWLLKSEGSSLWCRVSHSSHSPSNDTLLLEICRVLTIVMHFLVTTLPIFNYARSKEYTY